MTQDPKLIEREEKMREWSWSEIVNGRPENFLGKHYIEKKDYRDLEHKLEVAMGENKRLKETLDVLKAVHCRCIDMNAGVSSGPKQCSSCDMIDDAYSTLKGAKTDE